MRPTNLRLLTICALTAALLSPLFLFPTDQANAQLFRRAKAQASQPCPGGVCQVPQAQPCPGGVCQVLQAQIAAPQATPTAIPAQVAAQAVTLAETATVVATTPHVRCIAGNSCGSGTICGANSDGAYIVTNAHVAGTALGRQVNVDVVVNGAGVRTSGRTVMAGYSDSRMVDFCIIFVEGLSSQVYMPMLKTEPTAAPYGTTGSPKCVWPQVKKQFSDARNYGDGLITGLPNAIGGQSGSAIYNSDGHQIALLTWSMSGRCAGQKTSKLWQVAQSRNVQVADLRPADLRELAAPGSDRPATENGVFGFCALFETATGGARPVTENGVRHVVGSDMEELPIWFVPGGNPPPDCPDCPDCPECDPNCVVLNPTEKALIDAIRAQQSQTGIRDGEKATDWLRIISLIMELIKAIQEGRAGA